MFGYIKPNIPELKVREKQRYDAWYCGLCRSLGRRFGLASRLLLSYDSAFLAMIAARAGGSTVRIEKHICPVRPLAGLIGRKKPMAVPDGPAMDFAADVSVILARFKLGDDVRDGRPIAAAAMLPFLSAFRKARKRRPEVYEAVRKNYEELAVIEEAREPSLDLAANCFGEMLRKIFESIPLGGGDDAKRTVLSELGFFIGRTVYLFDAWDDREKDAAKGLYNPFNLVNCSREDAEFAVNYSVNSAISAYDLLEGGPGSAEENSVIENILHQGFFALFDRLTAEKAKKAERKARRKQKQRQ